MNAIQWTNQVEEPEVTKRQISASPSTGFLNVIKSARPQVGQVDFQSGDSKKLESCVLRPSEVRQLRSKSASRTPQEGSLVRLAPALTVWTA